LNAENLRQAHALVESGHMIGKVVVMGLGLNIGNQLSSFDKSHKDSKNEALFISTSFCRINFLILPAVCRH
jgi:hypothetical protein